MGAQTIGTIISSFLDILGRNGGTTISAREQIREGEALAREYMCRIRARLRRSTKGFGGDSKVRAGRDRHHRSVARCFLKAYRKAVQRDPRFTLDVDLMDAKFRESPILDRLVPSRRDDWMPLLQRPVNDIHALDIDGFDFIENPAETLRHLKLIAEIEGSARHGRLNFKDEFCNDAGAYLILAEIWPQMARVFAGGEMSVPVQKVLDATKVSQNNRMRTLAVEAARAMRQRSTDDIWAFPLQRRRPAGSSSSATQHLDQQAREKVADRFSSWTDTCLGESADLELTPEGRANIAMIMGELLCNAERHSHAQSDDGDWSITGFMVRRDEGGVERYRCMIAFLSVGQSIAESLDTAAEDIRELQSDYLAKHWQCGRSPMTLSTVLALQDTITCDPNARSARSGGTGLQDILEFVTTLGATSDGAQSPKVTIVSGKSCIRLRRPYIRGARANGVETKPRLLWFNESNSKELPPDESFVFDLEDHFAGTLVTIAFNLDAAFLRQEVENENGGDIPRGVDAGKGTQP